MARPPRADTVRGPDGLVRQSRTEHRLNGLVHGVLSSPQGADLMAYLKSITVLRTHPPGTVTTEELLMHEGARWLVGIIDERIRLGAEQAGHIAQPEDSNG